MQFVRYSLFLCYRCYCCCCIYNLGQLWKICLPCFILGKTFVVVCTWNRWHKITNWVKWSHDENNRKISNIIQWIDNMPETNNIFNTMKLSKIWNVLWNVMLDMSPFSLVVFHSMKMCNYCSTFHLIETRLLSFLLLSLLNICVSIIFYIQIV